MNKDSPVIHIIDDDMTVRQSLMVMVSAFGFPIQAHKSAAAFLNSADTQGHACVLTDIGNPNAGGLELVSELRETAPNVPVIVLTAHGDIQTAVKAMKAGASDFLVKPCDDDALISAIQQACADADNRQRRIKHRKSVQDRMALLSKRERQVLEGVVSGLPNKLIAHQLGLSRRTVEVFRASLMSKMNARTLAELVRMKIESDADVTRSELPRRVDEHAMLSAQSNGLGPRRMTSDRKAF